MPSKIKFQLPIISLAVLFGFMLFVLWQLLPIAPSQAHSKIGGIRLGTHEMVYLPGKMLVCQSAEKATQCNLQLTNQVVTLQVSENNVLGTAVPHCQAMLEGRSIPCQATWTLQHNAPYVVLNDDLNLSPAQLTQLQAENFFWQWTEANWLTWITLLGVAFSLNGAVLWWVWVDKYLKGKNFMRPVFYLVSSLATFTAVRFVLLIALLWLGFID